MGGGWCAPTLRGRLPVATCCSLAARVLRTCHAPCVPLCELCFCLELFALLPCICRPSPAALALSSMSPQCCAGGLTNTQSEEQRVTSSGADRPGSAQRGASGEEASKACVTRPVSPHLFLTSCHGQHVAHVACLLSQSLPPVPFSTTISEFHQIKQMHQMDRVWA